MARLLKVQDAMRGILKVTYRLRVVNSVAAIPMPDSVSSAVRSIAEAEVAAPFHSDAGLAGSRGGRVSQ